VQEGRGIIEWISVRPNRRAAHWPPSRFPDWPRASGPLPATPSST